MKTNKLSAAIDLGTNSFILTVIDDENKTVLEKYKTVALGNEKEKLDIRIERAKKALKEFLDELEKLPLRSLYIFGTQFFRKNPEIFEIVLQDVQVDSLKARILSEKEEALFSYLSVELDEKIGISDPVVVDVGGGSVEIVFRESKTLHYQSLEIGAWQLTNKFVERFPIGREVMLEMRKYISEQLNNNQPTNGVIVGLGGTFVTLAAMYENKSLDSFRSLHNTKVPKNWLEETCENLFESTLDEIKKTPNLPTDRARIMPAGILLSLEILDRLSNKDYLIVSARGCRYSIAKYGFDLKALLSPQRGEQ